MSLMLIRLKESPNQSERIHGNDAVRLIVNHTPEGGYAGTVNYVLNPNSDVSYHCLIKEDGTEATQFVTWDKKAWHAGAINSLSDGLAVEGYARNFDLADPGVKQLAAMNARRLVARKLPCQWTTDPAKGGFCRHGDLQADRTDPTPDLTEWKLFVAMVKEQYLLLTKPWPTPIPAWFWVWARWRLRVGEYKDGTLPRPGKEFGVPTFIPPWAWRRLAALIAAQKA